MTPEQPSMVIMGVVPVICAITVISISIEFVAKEKRCSQQNTKLVGSDLELHRRAIDDLNASDARVDQDLALNTAVDRQSIDLARNLNYLELTF